MNVWALLKDGSILNTVTTQRSRSEVEASHPGFEVRDLYTLPTTVLEAYEYWRERP